MIERIVLIFLTFHYNGLIHILELCWSFHHSIIPSAQSSWWNLIYFQTIICLNLFLIHRIVFCLTKLESLREHSLSSKARICRIKIRWFSSLNRYPSFSTDWKRSFLNFLWTMWWATLRYGIWIWFRDRRWAWASLILADRLLMSGYFATFSSWFHIWLKV